MTSVSDGVGRETPAWCSSHDFDAGRRDQESLLELRGGFAVDGCCRPLKRSCCVRTTDKQAIANQGGLTLSGQCTSFSRPPQIIGSIVKVCEHDQSQGGILESQRPLATLTCPTRMTPGALLPA